MSERKGFTVLSGPKRVRIVFWSFRPNNGVSEAFFVRFIIGNSFMINWTEHRHTLNETSICQRDFVVYDTSQIFPLGEKWRLDSSGAEVSVKKKDIVRVSREAKVAQW